MASPASCVEISKATPIFEASLGKGDEVFFGDARLCSGRHDLAQTGGRNRDVLRHADQRTGHLVVFGRG